MDDPALTPELLLQGYAAGIFPMAEGRDDADLFWVDPQRRGVLPLHGFHMSRSLARAMRRSDWHVALNHDFAGVLNGCADRVDTWINDELRSLYIDLHLQGDAHSIEIWEGAALVGGVYGVVLGAAFFGESMFSRRTNASKMALASAVHHLASGGFTLFDTQFMTAHLASLGGIEITRAAYRQQLARALEREAVFLPVPPTLQEVVQRMTQMS